MNKNELKRHIKSLGVAIKDLQIQQKFADCEQLYREVDVLTGQLREIELAERALLLESNNITAQEIVDMYHLAYLTQNDEFSITRNVSGNPDQMNIITRTYSSRNIIVTLRSLLRSEGLNSNLKMTVDDLIEFCINHQRSYTVTTSSFNTVKWDRNVHNHMSDLRKFWVPLVDADYISPVYDEVLYCIAGGKTENITHIEQWVAYKYLHPEDTVNIPNINISGIPGENGKGLFKMLLKTIFTDGSVVDATAKEVINGFNAKWRDAVILIYEEMSERELPENKLKALTGNPELVIENKGRDAFMSDANYNILFFDNNINGTVKLAGSGPNGEDRRYSIMETGISLPTHIQDKYNTSEDDAKLYCQKIAEQFRSRADAGAWLKRIIDKHQVTLMAQAPKLHGEDYYNRVANQTNEIDGIVAKIARAVISETVLPVRVMTDYIESVMGEKFKISATTLTRKVMAEMKRLGCSTPYKCSIRSVHLDYKPLGGNINSAPAISTISSDNVASLTLSSNPLETTVVSLLNRNAFGR
jgi:hypothetical protein